MQIARLEDPASPDFQAVHAIYEEALPPSERKSRAAIAALCRHPDYRLLSLCDGEAVAGFAILYLSPRLPFALLEYMAIDRTRRSAGLGAALYAACRSASAGRALLAEVDSTRDAKAPDYAQRTRRLRFYEACGSHVVPGLDYLLPALGGGQPPVMDLMIDLPDGMLPPTRTELADWLSDIYHHVYDQAADDPRIALMVADLPNITPLPSARP